MLTTLLAEAAHGAADAENAKGAFPAFDTWHWVPQAFWLIVIFIGLYIVLGQFILKKLAGTLERRSDTIVGALDEAHRLNEQAQEAQKALELRLSEARAKARETANTAQDKARAEIARTTEKAEAAMARLQSERDARIASEVSREMEKVPDLAASVAEALIVRLGGKPDAARIRAAIAQSVSSEG